MKEIAATSKAQGYAGDNKSHDKPQGKPPDAYASSLPPELLILSKELSPFDAGPSGGSHRRPRWVGLPNIVLFQFLFTLAAPVIDLLFLWSIFAGLWAYSTNPADGLHFGNVPLYFGNVPLYWIVFKSSTLEQSPSLSALMNARDGGVRFHWYWLNVSAIASSYTG